MFRSRQRRWATLVAASLLASLAVLATPGAASAKVCWDYTEKERKFATKTNDSRANHGRVKLSLDPQLSKVARRQARRMRDRGYIFHTENLGSKVTRWRMVGENVGVGSTVKSLHKAFMNSAPHRANILESSYRHIGVGTKVKGDRIYVAVVFESQDNPGTTLNMPSC